MDLRIQVAQAALFASGSSTMRTRVIRGTAAGLFKILMAPADVNLSNRPKPKARLQHRQTRTRDLSDAESILVRGQFPIYPVCEMGCR